MIKQFLDAILPGDSTINMPAGSRIDFAAYLRNQKGAAELLDQFLALLDAVATEQTGKSFAALDEDRRLECVEVVKRRNGRLSGSVIVHALKAYYTDAVVLRALSSDAVPPFPQGNSITEDDWSILEPVYERGAIFRCVTP